VTESVVVPPLKRVTLWVRNLERSLALYRDALGLEVLEEKQLQGAAIANMVGLEQASLRIVHLGRSGEAFGWIGLYEIRDTAPRPMADTGSPRQFPLYGQATLVFETPAVSEIAAKLGSLEGVTIMAGPTAYARADGTFEELILLDPDGIPVSLMGFTPVV
jgi:catechol 2,3-dioxygenase-like lactoylglutathione lyase family enzyme